MTFEPLTNLAAIGVALVTLLALIGLTGELRDLERSQDELVELGSSAR